MNQDKDNDNIKLDAENMQEGKNSVEFEQTWAELTQDWQAQPVPKTDIEQLLKRTRRRTNGAKFCFALNALVTLGLLIAFIYGVFAGQLGEPMNTYIGLGSLISIVLVFYEMKIRLAVWRSLCDSPSKAVDHAISACKSSMQYMVLTKVSTVPFFFLMNWFIYTIGKTSDKPLLMAYLFANGFLVVVYIATDYLHRKRRKEYQQLLVLKAD